MIRQVLSIGAMLGFALLSHAGVRRSIPPSGDPYSYFYQVLDVHEAHTPTTRVRVFDIPTDGKPGSVTQVLQVIADNRPPNMAKASRVLIWNLGSTFRTVNDVAIADTRININGWNYDTGRGSCTVLLRFKDGVLVDELEDQGCKWANGG